MIKETFYEYQITGKPVKLKTGKWAVSVIIEKSINGKLKSETYLADDNIHYILEIEAAKEGINLGMNLINKNHIGF